MRRLRRRSPRRARMNGFPAARAGQAWLSIQPTASRDPGLGEMPGRVGSLDQVARRVRGLAAIRGTGHPPAGIIALPRSNPGIKITRSHGTRTPTFFLSRVIQRSARRAATQVGGPVGLSASDRDGPLIDHPIGHVAGTTVLVGAAVAAVSDLAADRSRLVSVIDRRAGTCYHRTVTRTYDRY